MFSCKKNSILFWSSDTQTHYLWSQLRHFTLPLPLSRLTLEWISLLLQTASQYPQIFCPKGWHWQVIVTKYSLLYKASLHLYSQILIIANILHLKRLQVIWHHGHDTYSKFFQQSMSKKCYPDSHYFSWNDLVIIFLFCFVINFIWKMYCPFKI